MTSLYHLLGLTLMLTLSACSTSRSGPAVTPVTSAEKLSAAEWDQFANWMKTSMIQSGVLADFRQADGGPTVIAMADWDNTTRQRAFDRDKIVMENAIRKTLVNSGQAVINRDLGGTGARPDGLTQSIGELRESVEYDPSTLPEPGKAPAPSLGLFMQINRLEFTEGRTTQFDYAIKCELIDLHRKYTVWEDQFILSKQFVRTVLASAAHSLGTRRAAGDDRLDATEITGRVRGLGLVCREVRLAPTSGGRLEAQIDLVNTRSRPNRFTTRFRWLDQRGNLIRSQLSPSIPRTILGRGELTITSVAPAQGTDFTVEFRAGQ